MMSDRLDLRRDPDGERALGSALGAWRAGRIFDATGSYAIAFTLGAAPAAVTPLSVWAGGVTRRAQRQI